MSDSFLLKIPGLVFAKNKENGDFDSSKCHLCSLRKIKREKKLKSFSKNSSKKNDKILEIFQRGQKDLSNFLKE